VQTTQEIEIKEEPVIETTQKQKRVLIF